MMRRRDAIGPPGFLTLYCALDFPSLQHNHLSYHISVHQSRLMMCSLTAWL